MSIPLVAGGATLVALVVLVVAVSIMRPRACEARTRRYRLHAFEDRSFKVSWLGYFWPVAGIVLGLLFWS